MVRCLCLGSNEARLVFFKQNQGRSSCLMSSFLKKWAYTRMSHALQKKRTKWLWKFSRCGLSYFLSIGFGSYGIPFICSKDGLLISHSWVTLSLVEWYRSIPKTNQDFDPLAGTMLSYTPPLDVKHVTGQTQIKHSYMRSLAHLFILILAAFPIYSL